MSFTAVGDSKTLGETFLWTSQIQTTFQNAGGAARFYTPYAGNGYTTASVATGIGAFLAAQTYTPDYVFYCLGANDTFVPGGLPAEATWEANAGAILDALHAKWPNASVRVMNPYKGSGSFDADMDTLAGWMATVVSTRSAWASITQDERTWMKPNMGTYTYDTVHYSQAGIEALSALRLTEIVTCHPCKP